GRRGEQHAERGRRDADLRPQLHVTPPRNVLFPVRRRRRRAFAEATDSLPTCQSRTYLKIGCAARLLCRVLARPSLYVHVLSRASLRAFAYSGCSPHFATGSGALSLHHRSHVPRHEFALSVAM